MHNEGGKIELNGLCRRVPKGRRKEGLSGLNGERERQKQKQALQSGEKYWWEWIGAGKKQNYFL